MKRFLSEAKYYTLVLLSLPLGLAFYLAYVHFVSFIDPLLTIVLGGSFLLVILVVVVKLIINIKDFIVSIFKDDDEKDERGFKKHF